MQQKQDPQYPVLTSEDGFTLTELILVLALVGIMLVPLYSLIFYIKQLGPQEQRFERIQEALAEHLRVTGTLPCPADPALNMENNDNAYIAGNCTATGGITIDGGVAIGAVPIDNLRAAVNCTDIATARTLLNFTAGSDIETALKEGIYSLREVISGEKGQTDGAGNAIGSNRAEDVRCMPRDYMLDEYGHKFIYAVTIAATQTTFDIFNNATGQIRINNQAGLQATNNDQIYALISLGADGKGGRQANGIAYGITCGTPAASLDNENCDGDATFVAAPKNDQIGANFYDDHIDFGIAGFLTEDSFWRWGNNGTGGRDMILNNNARLILDADTTGMNANDSLFINSGGVGINQNMTVQSGRILVDAPTTAGVNPQANVRVQDKANAASTITSPKFCYEDPLVPDPAWCGN